MKTKTGLWDNGLIWFGAAVSLAEILTGTYFASMDFIRGMTAILLGHLIGCGLLFLAGVIGGTTGKSAMETVKGSFGQKGCLLFACLNVLQLLGWTAIMIEDGAIAAEGIFPVGRWVWALVIGGLITLWILIGIQSLGKLNTVAMSGLFLLTVLLSVILVRQRGGITLSGEPLSFGSALELSVAMPLSWLPLISDYTKDAKQPVRASAVSALVYGLVSGWMYLIGMGAARLAGSSDIAQLLLHAGLGIAGLLIVLLSTVSTTFLDAYSAGISWETLANKKNGKWVAVTVAILGTAGAILFPMENITDFLYLIGSVFAPMIAIQLADFFLLKTNREAEKIVWRNLGIWLLGFVLYRYLMQLDIPIGSTLPDMAVTICLCILFDKVVQRGKKEAPHLPCDSPKE